MLTKTERFLNLFVEKLFGVFKKMSTKYSFKRSKKTWHFRKTGFRGLSSDAICIHKKIHYVQSFGASPEFIWKPIWHITLIFKTHFPGSSKRFAMKGHDKSEIKRSLKKYLRFPIRKS